MFDERSSSDVVSDVLRDFSVLFVGGGGVPPGGGGVYQIPNTANTANSKQKQKEKTKKQENTETLPFLRILSVLSANGNVGRWDSEEGEKENASITAYVEVYKINFKTGTHVP
jgi:hypothetical protein